MSKNVFTLVEACEEVSKHTQFDRCYKHMGSGHDGVAYYFNMGHEKNVACWFPGLEVSILPAGRIDSTPAGHRRDFNIPDRFKTVVLQAPSSPDYNPVARAVLREKLKPAVEKIFNTFDSISREDAMGILLKALMEK